MSFARFATNFAWSSHDAAIGGEGGQASREDLPVTRRGMDSASAALQGSPMGRKMSAAPRTTLPDTALQAATTDRQTDVNRTRTRPGLLGATAYMHPPPTDEGLMAAILKVAANQPISREPTHDSLGPARSSADIRCEVDARNRRRRFGSRTGDRLVAIYGASGAGVSLALVGAGVCVCFGVTAFYAFIVSSFDALGVRHFSTHPSTSARPRIAGVGWMAGGLLN